MCIFLFDCSIFSFKGKTNKHKQIYFLTITLIKLWEVVSMTYDSIIYPWDFVYRNNSNNLQIHFLFEMFFFCGKMHRRINDENLRSRQYDIWFYHFSLRFCFSSFCKNWFQNTIFLFLFCFCLSCVFYFCSMMINHSRRLIVDDFVLISGDLRTDPNKLMLDIDCFFLDFFFLRFLWW